jgi:hypothetical protein
MWIAHLMLFWRPGLTAWLGAAVVLQMIVASLFNSQIFYFNPGWIYVFGVGVLGGMVLRSRHDPGSGEAIPAAAGGAGRRSSVMSRGTPMPAGTK